MKQFMDRRLFLKSAIALGLSTGPLYYLFKNNFQNHPSILRSPSDHFLIVCAMPGGLDVTLGLDPKTYAPGLDSSDIFIEYSASEILQKGNLKMGPACADIIKFYKDIAVVNGISAIRDAGHENNLAQILSGSLGGGLSHYAIQLAQHHKAPPLGILTNTPIITRSTFAALTDIQNIGQKLTLSSPSLSILGLSDILNSDLKIAARALELAESETYDVFRTIGKSGSTSELYFSTIAACFSTGLSVSAAVDISRISSATNLDSHTNHEVTHLKSQKSAWANVTQLFKIFKSVPYLQKSLFDHTTFVVTSEFSRTPYLNSSKGKDHNPYTNSALFAGRGVRGNTTIGESIVWSHKETPDKIPLHSALPIDFKTGQVAKSFSNELDIIVPENLAATILKLFNEKNLPKELKNFQEIPGVIKSDV